MAYASRDELITGLVQDHRVAPKEADRWCRAWETFATVHGRIRGPYFWDSGRGWIDAHLSKAVKAQQSKQPRKAKPPAKPRKAQHPMQLPMPDSERRAPARGTLAGTPK